MCKAKGVYKLGMLEDSVWHSFLKHQGIKITEAAYGVPETGMLHQFNGTTRPACIIYRNVICVSSPASMINCMFDFANDQKRDGEDKLKYSAPHFLTIVFRLDMMTGGDIQDP